MTDAFIHGIAGTGSVFGNRQTSIPRLEKLFGQYLPFTQQGEDERPAWLLEILARTWNLRGMVRKNNGAFRNYQDVPNVDFVDNRLTIPSDVLGISGEVKAAADVLNRLYGSQENWRRPLMAGFPFPGDFARFTFPTRQDLAARFQESFDQVVLREINAAHAIMGGNNSRMVLCLESPGSLTAMYAAHAQGQSLKPRAQQIADEFAAFASQLPEGMSVFIHLCHGDNGHKSWFGSIDGLGPLVALSNAIFQRWPHAHARFGGVFMPTCAADVLPSLNPEFFRPLHYLVSGIPVILGNIHEITSVDPGMSPMQALKHNLDSFALAVEALGRPALAGSFSCGTRRMSKAGFRSGLEIQRGMIDIAGTQGPVYQ